MTYSHYCYIFFRAMGIGRLYTVFKAECVAQCKQSWTDMQLLCCIASINGTAGQLQMINGGHMENSMLVLTSKDYLGM